MKAGAYTGICLGNGKCKWLETYSISRLAYFIYENFSPPSRHVHHPAAHSIHQMNLDCLAFVVVTTLVAEWTMRLC